LPDTTPVLGSTVAMFELLLVHVPPGTVLLSCVVAFWQIVVAPIIDDGAFTVSDVVVLPQILVAVIIVVPLPMLVLLASPVLGSMVATVVLLLVHVPVGTPLLLNVTVPPRHTVAGPDILDGAAITVTATVGEAPQPVA
jgi:hypothetical protein